MAEIWNGNFHFFSSKLYHSLNIFQQSKNMKKSFGAKLQRENVAAITLLYLSLMLSFYVISFHPSRRWNGKNVFICDIFHEFMRYIHNISILIQMNARSQCEWANCSPVQATTMGAIIHTENPILAMLMPTKMPRKSWAELFRIVLCSLCCVCVY